MSPALENVNMYNENCKFPLVYDSETDLIVIRKMELMAVEMETQKDVSADLDMDSDVEIESMSDDSSDSESDRAEDKEDAA